MRSLDIVTLLAGIADVTCVLFLLNDRLRSFASSQLSQKTTRLMLAAALIFCFILTTAAAATAIHIKSTPSTLAKIKEADELVCGVNGTLAGFSQQHEGNPPNYTEKDIWKGFDPDFCRVVASAIFGDEILDEAGHLESFEDIRPLIDRKISFQKLSDSNRLSKVADREVDILFRNTSWTVGRDLEKPILFGPTIFYDEQQIYAKNDSGIHYLSDLDGKTICVQNSTTSWKNIENFKNTHGINVALWDPASEDGTEGTDQDRLNKVDFFDIYASNLNCHAITADQSQLKVHPEQMKNSSAITLKMSPDLDNQLISKELLSPVYRDGDSSWRDIVNYSVYATIRAAELGISQANVKDEARDPKSFAAMQFLGLESNDIEYHIGPSLGISQKFAQNIIRLVGSYYDIFDRNLSEYYPPRSSSDTSTQCAKPTIENDKNQLWHCGGVLISPPFTTPESIS
ncbi:transporter substrate-binding domain-containing protein [Leptolyngbya cf. ectocarpi LEGE 11479]|uniref:Transporter substrate-binding domain-containing protein n=1 Tax=Leptolyngbya cf. ectocarpi LEGE 11479 TaxID=1828722 RepID=A0A928ZXQ4_LEPEC|nr:transporter substrate-binding domain-containing protein [Leptolyngbya ectocarpi]MBE9069370.1 transporter substrate-binding domain-containing protein [Leptolyngbya cf. ectocarpi LEGE 11479]